MKKRSVLLRFFLSGQNEYFSPVIYRASGLSGSTVIQHFIIMRHGIAEDYNAKGDRYRSLTAAGKMGVKKVSAMLKEQCDALGLNLHRVLHSPYLRTTQTAEILSENIANQNDQTIKVEPSEPLISGAKVQSVINGCPESKPGEITVLITHQPLISRLLAELVLGDASAASEFPMLPGDAHLLSGDLFASGLLTSNGRFSASSFL